MAGVSVVARVRRRANGMLIPMSLTAIIAVGLPTAWAQTQQGEAEFEQLAERVRTSPHDLLAGNELRRLCRQRKRVDSCIKLFERLVSARPDVSEVRYNAALAYVDNLPGHSLLVQARLSTNSIGHASAVLDRSPDDWTALYIRGLNNLYWPKWYRRTGRSIEDLGRCVQLTEARAREQRAPHMALAYAALGDAYVKQEQIDRAVQTWQRGVEMVGESAELRMRLGIAADRLPAFVDAARSREAPVDTDLSRILAAGRS